MKFRMLLRVCIILPVYVLMSCASMPSLAPQGADQRAKTFSPPSDKAAIYIYRKNGWRGSAVKFPVTVNGQMIANIGNGTYYVVEVDPGENDVWVGWDQDMSRTLEDPTNYKIVYFPINAAAGQVYFVRASQTDQNHEAVAPSIGKAELLACCKLAEQEHFAPTLYR